MLQVVKADAASNTQDAASYEVGHCKPPKEYQFKPGQSGNPSGKSKKPKQLADKIQKQADKLVDTLVRLATSEETPDNVKIQAINTLLDRGFGKAPQTLDVNQRHSLSDELEQHIRQLNGLPPTIDVTPDE